MDIDSLVCIGGQRYGFCFYPFNLAEIVVFLGGLAVISLSIQWLARRLDDWSMPRRLERLMKTAKWKQQQNEWAAGAAQRAKDGKMLEEVWYRMQLEEWHKEYKANGGQCAPFPVWAGLVTQECYDAWARESGREAK